MCMYFKGENDDRSHSQFLFLFFSFFIICTFMHKETRMCIKKKIGRVRFDFMLTKIAKQPWSIFGQESSKTHGTLCHS